MSKLDDLLAKRDELDKQIEAAREAEKAGALTQISEICKAYKISYADLKPVLTKQRKSKTKAGGDATTAS